MVGDYALTERRCRASSPDWGLSFSRVGIDYALDGRYHSAVVYASGWIFFLAIVVGWWAYDKLRGRA